MNNIRTQQRLATQRNILETARKLFQSASYSNVGVREIATEAGVATGTVITAFGSKADLLHEIVIEDIAAQLDLMKAAVQGVDDTYSRICEASQACLKFQSKRQEILRASMSDAWTRSDDAENRISDAMRPIHHFLMAELERGVVRGELRHNLNTRIGAIMLIETLINTYRIPIYNDTPLTKAMNVMIERLNLVLEGFGLCQRELVESAA